MWSIADYYQPQIKLWGRRTGFNAFNRLVVVSWLTDEGREKAKGFWFEIGVFVLAVAVPFDFTYLAETVTGMEIVLS